MKFHTKNNKFERSNIQAESAFTIKTTAKAFDILSSGLYTDPITAIIRELSCNAYDAHVAAKKENIPFDIHLPNTLEPFFYVKDYGTGLSDKQVRGEMVPIMQEDSNGEFVQVVNDKGEPQYRSTGGLYTTYFDSTKNDSNDFIGALGLGSKSPFSYTTAFDVISIFGGTKSIYSVFLNEDGIPTVALMGQSSTTDSNGLEVRLTVDKKDFRTFESATASVLRYFPVKPKIKGVPNFSFVEIPKEVLRGDGWFIAPIRWNRGDSLVAVQGHVPYRVNTSQLKNLSDAEETMIDLLTVVAFFEIGDLDVAANREEIRYDDQTVKVLKDKINVIQKELLSVIEKELNKYKNSFWDACIAYNNMSYKIFDNRYAITRFINNASNKTSPLLQKLQETDGTIKLSNLRGHEIVQYEYPSWKIRRDTVDTIRPDSNTQIFFNDIKVRGISRVRELLKTTDVNRVIVINPLKDPIERFESNVLNSENNKPKLIPFVGHKKEYESIVQQLGNPKITNTSTLNPIVSKPKSKSLTFFKYGSVVQRGWSSWQREQNSRVEWYRYDETEIPDSGLVFFLEHGCYVTKFLQKDKTSWDYDHRCHLSGPPDWAPKQVKHNLEMMVSVINHFQKTKYTLDDVFGATLKSYKEIRKNKGWIDIFELFDNCIPKLLNETIPLNRFNNTPNKYDIKDSIKEPIFMQHVNSLDDTSQFKRNMLILHDYHLLTQKLNKNPLLTLDFYQFIIMYCDCTGIPLPKQSEKPLFDEKVFDKYPMLEYIDGFKKRYNDPKNKLTTAFDYIKIIDRSS